MMMMMLMMMMIHDGDDADDGDDGDDELFDLQCLALLPYNEALNKTLKREWPSGKTDAWELQCAGTCSPKANLAVSSASPAKMSARWLGEALRSTSPLPQNRRTLPTSIEAAGSSDC